MLVYLSSHMSCTFLLACLCSNGHMQVTSCLLCLLINSVTWLSPAACSFLLGRERTAACCWKCWSCSPHVLSQPCFVLSETLTWSNFLCYKTPSSLFWSSITTRKSERNFQKNQRERREKIWKKTIRKIQRKFWREIWEWTTLPNPLVPWISDWGVWKN